MTRFKAWIPALFLLAASPAFAARSSKVAVELDKIEDYQSAFHKVSGPASCASDLELYAQNNEQGRLESLTLTGIVDVQRIGGDRYVDEDTGRSLKSERIDETSLLVHERTIRSTRQILRAYTIRLFRSSTVHRLEILQKWRKSGANPGCSGASCRGQIRCVYEYEI